MRNRIQKSMIFVVTMSYDFDIWLLWLFTEALKSRREWLGGKYMGHRKIGEEYFGTMDKVVSARVK